MAIRKVYDNATGKLIGYKARYYYIKDGKKKDADTKTCKTEAAALKEAERLKKYWEQCAADEQLQRRNKQVQTAWTEFIASMEEENKINYTNGNVAYIETARAILKKHMPLSLATMRVSDMETVTLRDWFIELNKNPSVGGKAIRLYKIVICKFNRWLSNHNYYTEKDMDVITEFALSKVKNKPSSVNNKVKAGKRSILNINQFAEFQEYWEVQGLENFTNFYYYTLFYVLFFSGIRVEELCALQWEDIDLFKLKTITIKNAIQQKEKEAHVMERMNNHKFLTKNEYSQRIIPIFEVYYELLIDYEFKYRQYFNKTREEIQNGFVFPNLARNDIFAYGRNKAYWLALKKAQVATGMPNTDLQMFRHSCATFLIMPPPIGRGFTRDEIYEYFGHEDTKMLEDIYSKLDKSQSVKRMSKTFEENGIFAPNPQAKAIEELVGELNSEFVEAETNKVVARYNRGERIRAEIAKAINNQETEYYYLSKDKSIIDEYKTENPNCQLTFVEE